MQKTPVPPDQGQPTAPVAKRTANGRATLRKSILLMGLSALALAGNVGVFTRHFSGYEAFRADANVLGGVTYIPDCQGCEDLEFCDKANTAKDSELGVFCSGPTEDGGAIMTVEGERKNCEKQGGTKAGEKVSFDKMESAMNGPDEDCDVARYLDCLPDDEGINSVWTESSSPPAGACGYKGTCAESGNTPEGKNHPDCKKIKE